jgi:hypothetical protein
MSVRNGSGRPVDYTIIPPPGSAVEELKQAMRFTAVVTCLGLGMVALGALLHIRPLLWFGAGVALAGGATWLYLRSLSGKAGGPRIQDLAGSTKAEARSPCASLAGLSGSLAPGESVAVGWNSHHLCAKVIFKVYAVDRKPDDGPIATCETSMHKKHAVTEVALMERTGPQLEPDLPQFYIEES